LKERQHELEKALDDLKNAKGELARLRRQMDEVRQADREEKESALEALKQRLNVRYLPLLTQDRHSL